MGFLAFGSGLDLKGRTLLNGISALIKRGTQRALSPLLPCDDTMRRQPSQNKEVGPKKTHNFLAL